MILDVHLTTRCNLHCKHCYLNKTDLDKRKDMDLPLFLEILTDFLTFPSPKKQFILSGGEPLLHRQFDKIVEHMRLSGMRLSIATNGTLVTDKIDLFEEKDGIQISLDGDRYFHDWLRGQGVYDAVIQAIEDLKERNFFVGLSYTVCGENKHLADHIIKLAKKYGIKAINVNMFMDLSNAEITPLTVDEFKQVREKFKKEGFIISEPCYLRGRCIAGIAVLSVLPDGTFWDCSRSQMPLGKGLISDVLLWDYVKIRGARESCITIKRDNLYDLIKHLIKIPRTREALNYLDTFRRYSIEELEELDRLLTNRISKIKDPMIFAGTVNCLYVFSKLKRAVAYTNDRFIKETVEFVEKFANTSGMRHYHGECNGTCDYLEFLKVFEKVVITCWSACNSDEKDGRFIDVFRDIDGRKLDKLTIYWYYRKFKRLPKWWMFFQCDLGCKDAEKDELLRYKFEAVRELFGD